MCMHRESAFPNGDQTWADHKTEDNGNLQGFYLGLRQTSCTRAFYLCLLVCMCVCLIYLLVTHRGLFLGLLLISDVLVCARLVERFSCLNGMDDRKTHGGDGGD